MKKGGIGAAVFIIILLLVAFRNEDGDWFTPEKRSKVETPDPDKVRFDFGKSEQVLIVTADSWGATHATAALWEKQKDGSWKNATGDAQARIGRNGFSQNRREGDGTTPAGKYRLTAAFGSAKEGSTNLPYSKLEPGDCWISDTDDPKYNQWTTRTNCSLPNENLYERAKDDGPYAHAVVIDFNTNPTVNGVGSAIFVFRNELLKGSKSTTTATKAGVTLSNDDLMDVFRRLAEDAHPVIVMGPLQWILGPKENLPGVDGVDGEKIDLGPDGAG